MAKLKIRDYKHEYAIYGGKPEQIHERSLRNQARRKEGLKVDDPREVDHIKSMKHGGRNSKSNLRIVSRHINRTKGANGKA